MKPKELFDTYALNYDEVLNHSLSISGLTKDYFANGRIEWLKDCFTKLNLNPRVMMDYGCGTGSAIPYLAQIIHPAEMIGVDVSEASLAEAKKLYPDPRIRFQLATGYQDADAVDGVYCSCVFHHIPVAERLAAFQYIHRALKPGGIFSLWEHNPWNLATQYIVSQCEFDRDAILLFPAPTRKLLAEAGFEIIATQYLFIFPASLKVLKPLEKYFSSLPLGAQYQILCRKK
jgi:SAM-dependent methyltransferase